MYRHVHVAAVGAVDVLVTPEIVVACPGDMVTLTCLVQRGLGLQWILDSVSLNGFIPLDIDASSQPGPNRNAIVNGVTFNAVLIDAVPVDGGFYNLTSTLTTTASEETDGILIRCNDTRDTAFDDVTIRLMGKCNNYIGKLHLSNLNGCCYMSSV